MTAHTLANAAISLSYFWIGGGLLSALPSAPRQSTRVFLGSAGAFVLSCGVGHALEGALGMTPSVTLWHLVTASVSVSAAVLITKASPELKRAAVADEVNRQLLDGWAEPLGLYAVEGEDLRILYQNQAAIADIGRDLTGAMLCEEFPSHLEPNGVAFGGEPESRLIDVYLAAAAGQPWQGDLCYVGDGVDGWYRTRAQPVGQGIALITWRDVSDEKISIETQVLFSRVQRALVAREFVLHYQPIIELATDKVAGYEALVRWPRGDGTFRNPGEFLYSIESTELINSLCWQVSEMACTEIKRWEAAGINEGCYLAINIAPFTIASDIFESQFNSILDKHNAPRNRIVVEITEEAALEQPIVPRVERLKLTGLRVGIDDFGTGQTSFKNLYAYPADLIKVDRAFIADLIDNPASQELVATIVRLAKVLRMSVVAEGVETAEVAEWLRQNGVAYGQGWHWAKAGPLQ